jgi:hypothetical protein
MGVTGAKFLELSKAEAFEVAKHALYRLREHTGFRFSEDEALGLFRAARQVRPKQLIWLGYRPAYGRRKANGQKSWYFRTTVAGREVIAVVGEGDLEGQFVWVTTYGRNAQTDQLRAASYEALAYAT